MASHTYRHFGLTAVSEWPLPLENANIDGCRVDVRVRRGRVDVVGRLAWQSRIGPPCACYEAVGAHILEMGSARFAVTGDSITIDAADNAWSTQLLLFPVWAAVLSIRGRESFHGAVVARDGRGIAIFGASGSGKSTATLRLIDQGWRLVTDDLIAFDDAGRVLPGPPFMRLCADRAVGRDARPDGAGKYRLMPPHSDEPPTLTAAVILSPTVSDLRILTNLEAMQALLTTPYNLFPTASRQSHAWFAAALELARKLPVYGAPPRSLSIDQLLAIASG